MTRRRHSVGGGNSPDPRKRARSLANLRRGNNPPPAGNQRAVTHGAFAALAVERLDAKRREVVNAIAADAPLRDPDGGLPAADGAMVSLLADCLCRLEDVRSYLRDRGLLDADGVLRPAVEVERKLRQEAADYLDAMAMSPRSRAKLGVDTARTFDLARYWAEQDTEERDEQTQTFTYREAPDV